MWAESDKQVGELTGFDARERCPATSDLLDSLEFVRCKATVNDSTQKLL